MARQLPRALVIAGSSTDEPPETDIDADASSDDIQALVAQSQKRSAVYDMVTNPTNVAVEAG